MAGPRNTVNLRYKGREYNVKGLAVKNCEFLRNWVS
jgi:hypothetical protein